MELHEARQYVIDAGKRLASAGLIARTWGNVSCRISDDQFVITPSGRAYDTLEPADIVIVNIADLSYEGSIKPSSEKGVHAEVYKQRPWIHFVIHTHQDNASIAAVLGCGVDIANEDTRRLIGEKVELAAYGLPGTGKLRKGVSDALKISRSKAILMAHHGTVCMGATPDEAFAVAIALEKECKRFLAQPQPVNMPPLHSSRREGDSFVLETLHGAIAFTLEPGSVDAAAALHADAALHRAIYLARPDIRVIKASGLPALVDVSAHAVTVKPLLDDFAQLIGTSLRCADWDEGAPIVNARRVVQALQGCNAVLIRGRGALCCAGNASDAEAVEMVLDKGCKAYLAAAASGRIKPISPLECKLMRYIYLKKYSKMDQSNK